VTGAAIDPGGQESVSRTGLAYGLAAFAFWGLVPVYFKAVASVSALEVLAHRVVWSLVILAGLVAVRRQLPAVRAVLADARTVAALVATTGLIAGNWYLFIWAVANGRVLQASLGYFINPLVNVALGVVFLRERLSRAATVAVALATLGVIYQTVLGGRFPWIALTLACSFGLYGLLRKTARAGPIVGLGIETALLAPVALIYLAWLRTAGSLRFAGGDETLDLLLVAAGVVTAVPLLWFARAAQLLPLSVVGFLQYLAPTMHFVLAVAFYGERFGGHHAVTFGCIWTALAIFTADRLRRAPRV
jgi:chloramphenicol-sensitive protein RarD